MGKVFKHTLAKAEADRQMYRGRPRRNMHSMVTAMLAWELELGKYATTEPGGRKDDELAAAYRDFEEACREFLR